MAWKHIIGNEAVRIQLEHAWKRGRLGHAYLFDGPAGIGKVAYATEFAKALLCERATKSLEACDECASCHLVAAGTHPDFHLVRKPDEKHEFPIELMRELMLALSLKPARGSRKIAIIDHADDLNEESSNAFLKTLEEPPAGSVFILVGTAAERQLPTIRSRCQIIHFRPLTPKQVREVLVAQGVDDPMRRDRLVPLAAGSPGQALILDDGDLWDFREQFVKDLAQPQFDPVALADRWMKFVEEAGKESALQRARAGLVLRLLMEMFKQALRLAVGGLTRDLDASERHALTQLAKRLGPEGLLKWLERSLEFDMHIDRKVQLVLSLEAFMDALGQTQPTVDRTAAR